MAFCRYPRPWHLNGGFHVLRLRGGLKGGGGCEVVEKAKLPFTFLLFWVNFQVFLLLFLAFVVIGLLIKENIVKNKMKNK